MLAPDLHSYVQALVDYAEQTTDGIDRLKTLRDTLFDKLEESKGKELVNTGVNGKSMGFWLTMPAEQQFYAVVKAIKIYEGDSGSGQVTFIDFCGL